MRNRFVRTAVAFGAAAALTMGMAACGSDTSGGGSAESGSDDGAAAAGGDYKVALLVSTLNNPFFVDLRDGAQDAAKDAGIKLEVSDAQNDSITQANQAQDAKSQGYDAVIINPVDSDAAGPSVQELIDAGIPVISVDRTVEGVEVTSHIASDNVAGGEQAAVALAAAMSDAGEAVVLQGVPGTSASRDRGEGFETGISAFSDITVVAKQTANFDRAEGLDVTTNLLQAHPGVTGIFAENDEMALGAVQSLGSRAGSDVMVFGFDGTEDALDAIEAGTMVGTIAQQPRLLGATAVETALAILKGDTVDTVVDVPVTTVTKENVADFK